MGDSGVDSEQTSNSTEESLERQPLPVTSEHLGNSAVLPGGGRTETFEETKATPVKVNNLAAFWEERLKEKEREVVERSHLNWKMEKPHYLGWNKENLQFKPKPLTLDRSSIAEEEEDDTLNDCLSLSDTEEGQLSESETEFGEEHDHNMDKESSGTFDDDDDDEEEDEEGEEETDGQSETSSYSEETASYHGGQEVGTLRQIFEQLLANKKQEALAQHKGMRSSTSNKTASYQGGMTAPELRQAVQEQALSAQRKAISIELQGNRCNNTSSDDDESSSKSENDDGDPEEGERDSIADDEDCVPTNKSRTGYAEEEARSVGRLPTNRLLPFLAANRPQDGHHQLEQHNHHFQGGHYQEEELLSPQYHGENYSNSNENDTIEGSRDPDEYSPYTPLARWHPPENEVLQRNVTESMDKREKEGEEEEIPRQPQPPVHLREKKTSVKELRDRFARGRIVEEVNRKKEEDEDELRHIPEDLRQFFRTPAVNQESFIDEEEREEISEMVNRFKEEEDGVQEDGDWRIQKTMSGREIEDEEHTTGRMRRPSMERLSLFQIPT